MIVLEAARRAPAGATLDEIVALAEDMARRTRVFGTLDTLEYLKKGGRIGAAQALLGSILSIKPVIEVVDGEVEPGPKLRTRSVPPVAGRPGRRPAGGREPGRPPRRRPRRRPPPRACWRPTSPGTRSSSASSGRSSAPTPGPGPSGWPSRPRAGSQVPSPGSDCRTAGSRRRADRARPRRALPAAAPDRQGRDGRGLGGGRRRSSAGRWRSRSSSPTWPPTSRSSSASGGRPSPPPAWPTPTWSPPSTPASTTALAFIVMELVDGTHPAPDVLDERGPLAAGARPSTSRAQVADALALRPRGRHRPPRRQAGQHPALPATAG